MLKKYMIPQWNWTEIVFLRNLQYYLELSGENLELLFKKENIKPKYTKVNYILEILQHVWDISI